ncbi:hypothetical protein [Streptomyces sp. NPDC057052]|uniref:hypothetical protein n=1 Tax=Streptomyces sp. NPDC057052 TaxID=3346010 RepID=UPI00363A16AE
MAQDLGIHPGTLHSWVSRARRNRSPSSDRPVAEPSGGRLRESERAELEWLSFFSMLMRTAGRWSRRCSLACPWGPRQCRCGTRWRVRPASCTRGTGRSWPTSMNGGPGACARTKVRGLAGSRRSGDLRSGPVASKCWRCSPAERRPLFKKPVPPRIRTASGSPEVWMAHSRTSSKPPSASHPIRFSSRRTRPGPARPTFSARGHSRVSEPADRRQLRQPVGIGPAVPLATPDLKGRAGRVSSVVATSAPHTEVRRSLALRRHTAPVFGVESKRCVRAAVARRKYGSRLSSAVA